MERLIYGISAINFQHCNKISNENCAPNYYPTMANITDGSVVDFNQLPPVSVSPFKMLSKGVRNDVQSTIKNSETEEQTNDNTSSSSETCSRRKVPFRASKPTSMLDKTKRRSIMKPAKRLAKATGDLSSLGTRAIQKIYLNKKLTNFHPSKLETIFEEPQADSRNTSSRLLFTGARKLKRSLSLCDGLNTSKTLIKQRRQKIKKTFGRRFALKKISLDDFLHRLNNTFETPDVENQLEEEGNETAFDEISIN